MGIDSFVNYRSYNVLILFAILSIHQIEKNTKNKKYQILPIWGLKYYNTYPKIETMPDMIFDPGCGPKGHFFF